MHLDLARSVAWRYEISAGWPVTRIRFRLIISDFDSHVNPWLENVWVVKLRWFINLKGKLEGILPMTEQGFMNPEFGFLSNDSVADSRPSLALKRNSLYPFAVLLSHIYVHFRSNRLLRLEQPFLPTTYCELQRRSRTFKFDRQMSATSKWQCLNHLDVNSVYWCWVLQRQK